MPTNGYVQGTTTFKAHTDLKQYRLVVMVDGSITTPVEVKYADDGILIGITLEPVLAEENVAILPLNAAGTYMVECHVDTDIQSGTPMYLTEDSTGRISDLQGLYYVGQALTVGVDGQSLSVGGLVGAVGSSSAGEVSLLDEEDYYTSENVEGALAEIAASVSGPQSYNIDVTNMRRANSSAFDILPMADLGGLMASDTEPELSLATNSSLRINMTSAAPAVYYMYQVFPFKYAMNMDEDITLNLRTHSVDTDNTFNVEMIVLDADGGVLSWTESGIMPDINEIVSYPAITIAGGTYSTSLVSATCRLTLGKPTGTYDIQLYGLSLDYTGVLI